MSLTKQKQTKNFKLYSALAAGEALSEAAITKRFSIQNPRAEVTRIRKAGYTVTPTKRIAGNHRQVTEYVMSQSDRDAVLASGRAARKVDLA